MRKIYAFDTETTTKPPAVAYLSGYVDISDFSTFKWFRNLEDFIDSILNLDKGSVLYAHNLKFDYSYLFYIFKTNPKYSHLDIKEMITGKEKKVRRVRIVNTVSLHYIELRDSFAIFTSPLEAVLKGWNKEYQTKTKVEYYEYVPETISDEFFEYFKADVLGLAEALRQRLEIGQHKLTTSSDSKAVIRDMINERFKDKKANAFSDWFFPNLKREIDAELRPFYRGGFCYVNPSYTGKPIEKPTRVYDVNSMYPSIMESEKLPVGAPIIFRGKPDINRLFCVKIIVDWCEIKDNYAPFLVNGSVNAFFSTAYVEAVSEYDSEQFRTFYLTKAEYELFLDSYEYGNINHIGGFYFNYRTDLFKPYIDLFRTMKEENTGALRECAKLFLNAPSGKWGESPDQQGYRSVLEEGVQKFEEVPPTEKDLRKDAFYLPVSMFITAYARVRLLRVINKIGLEDFVYCDTDSIHCIGNHDHDFDIDNKRFGAWKLEGIFSKAIYLRTKRYAHEYVDKDGEVHTEYTCAGIGKRWFSVLNGIDEFQLGRPIPVMRMFMRVGGMQPEMINVTI